MNVDSIEVPMGDALKAVTLTIRLTRPLPFKIRLFVGIRVMKLGSWITGLGSVKIERPQL